MIIDPSFYALNNAGKESRYGKSPRDEDEFYATYASNGLLDALAFIGRLYGAWRMRSVRLFGKVDEAGAEMRDTVGSHWCGDETCSAHK